MTVTHLQTSQLTQKSSKEIKMSVVTVTRKSLKNVKHKSTEPCIQRKTNKSPKVYQRSGQGRGEGNKELKTVYNPSAPTSSIGFV